jgi:hypothetical protein
MKFWVGRGENAIWDFWVARRTLVSAWNILSVEAAGMVIFIYNKIDIKYCRINSPKMFHLLFTY